MKEMPVAPATEHRTGTQEEKPGEAEQPPPRGAEGRLSVLVRVCGTAAALTRDTRCICR